MSVEPLANRHPLDIWAWVALRFVLGFMMLWGFVDKVFGLGYMTSPGQAWIDGVSPTTGYLNFATGGVFGELFRSMADNPLVDIVFMISLLAIGLSLLLGIGLKITAIAGTAFSVLMWLSNFPPKDNPLVEYHVIYIFVLIGIAWAKAGRWVGLGNWWRELPIVKKHPILE